MLRKGIVLITIILLLTITFAGCFGPEDVAETKPKEAGFEGVSHAQVIPVKAAMLVQHDSESYTDDYAYLAGVPASVFFDDNSNKLISYPLLYYDEPGKASGQDLVLNGGQGVEYFMEDWMTYSDGELDLLQIINAPADTLKSKWPARKNVVIDSEDHTKIAASIAETNWAYSDEAVLAVAEADYSRPDIVTDGEISGSTPAMSVETIEFKGTAEPAPISPIFHPFFIEKDYKYISAVVRTQTYNYTIGL